MATTKLDTAYSAFIMEVVPLLSQMKEDELEDLLSDITAKFYSEIDRAKETQRDFMEEQKSDNEIEQGVIDDDDGNLIS